MTALTRLYGCTIRSEIPIYQQRPVPVDAAVDLEINLGRRIGHADDLPAGQVLIQLRSERDLYVALATPDGYQLRFYGTCDIRLNPELTRATIEPVDGADEAVISVLAGGTLLAFVLAMRGAAVLHGSAVQIGDSAVAFVGASGMGKSTMATLMCVDGARLITDDLLRLDLGNTPPTCSLGATELRLRNAAAQLAGRFAHTPGHRVTGDERDALALAATAPEDLPLRAIVIPFPDKTPDLSGPTVERLDPMAAFLMLSRFPRLLGWEDGKVLARQFQQLGAVVDNVPVYAACLPWGPPFAADLAARVRAAVGLG